jgi:arylsulfatase A-like enzyme
MNEPDPTPANIVVVCADTLRTAYLGAYGNDWIQTPNLDRFAQQGVRFTNAHPECLPTIPTRRTLHSGRRAFPFNNYEPVPWDNVYIPGWQPLSPHEGTMAEALVQSGYHTGFYGDVPHYFVPGMNFIRGFQQWSYIRGQAEDRYRAAAHADPSQIARYKGNEPRIRAHLMNVQPERPEENWPTARTFREAIEFIEHNQRNSPFYLYVDSFSPHETWEAPMHYYDLYGRRDEREPICLNVPYASLDQHPDYENRIESIKANYAGMITMVDTWFGKLIDTIDRLRLREQTMVIFLSDHGTNFADNAQRIMGKPADYMYPGTMCIPMMVRHPSGAGAGTTCSEFVYTTDVPATVGMMSNTAPVGGLDGQSLLPLVEGRSGFNSRDYLTCRYGNSVWFKDHQTWFFSDVNFENPSVFDLEADPLCWQNIASQAQDRVERAKDHILDDAGGVLLNYTRTATTDALGRPEFSGDR